MYNAEDFTVLMVDDLPKNIQVLGSTLRSNNYQVEYATSGERALEWIEELDFDLILLDIMMPGIDGYEVCRRIRSNTKYNDIPIIFLTAKSDKESIVKGFEIGGQDYITKPFDASELLARVKTHLELKVSKQLIRETNKRLELMVDERTKELKKANKKLIELDNAKTQFLKIISHEIRTPLNGIVNSIELMKEISLSEEMEFFLEILDESSVRLESFSYKALDISNLNINGKNVMDFSSQDVDLLMEAILYRSKKSADLKELHFDFEAGSNIIEADGPYLKKCLEHLIHNAIKFANHASTIKVAISKKGNRLLIQISDEGEKFPDGFEIKDLESFSATKHIDQNPGLSLYLCRLIIEAHSGKIDATNTEKGACVVLELPA